MKLVISTTYPLDSDTEFELPEGKTWSDVKHWGVKYCTLYLVFEDGIEMEVDIEPTPDDFETIEGKYPSWIRIRPVDTKYGGADWNAEPLAEDVAPTPKELKAMLKKYEEWQAKTEKKT